MDASFFDCAFCRTTLNPPKIECPAGHVVCLHCYAGHRRVCTDAINMDRVVRTMGSSSEANAAPGTRVRRGVEELQRLYPSLAMTVERITDDADESLRPTLKRAFQLISDEKARELDAKLKKLMAKEVQMTLKLAALKSEVCDLLMDKDVRRRDQLQLQ